MSAALTCLPGLPSFTSTSQEAFVQLLSPAAVAAALFAFARNFSSYLLFSMIHAIIAEDRAASEPGLIGSHFQALDANLLNLGSATAIFVSPLTKFFVKRTDRFGGP